MGFGCCADYSAHYFSTLIGNGLLCRFAPRNDGRVNCGLLCRFAPRNDERVNCGLCCRFAPRNDEGRWALDAVLSASHMDKCSLLEMVCFVAPLLAMTGRGLLKRVFCQKTISKGCYGLLCRFAPRNDERVNCGLFCRYAIGKCSCISDTSPVHGGRRNDDGGSNEGVQDAKPEQLPHPSSLRGNEMTAAIHLSSEDRVQIIPSIAY